MGPALDAYEQAVIRQNRRPSFLEWAGLAVFVAWFLALLLPWLWVGAPVVSQ